MFLGKVSSNVDSLNILHEKYDWIPGKNDIRPSKNIIKMKIKLFNLINNNYNSIKDYILEVIFNYSTEIIDNKKSVISTLKPHKKFIINKFPYNVTGNHYIMWYLMYDINTLSDDIITFDIYNNIYQMLKNNNFNFVWFINPKMSIPDIFHVQVFWVKNK